MKKNKTVQYALYVILSLALMSGAFFGGVQYQKTQSQNVFKTMGNRQFQGMRNGSGTGMQGQGNRQMNGRAVMGEVTAQDEKTITIKQPDGGSRIVIFSQTTSINKAVQTTKADIKVGEKVSVFGTQNTDGSVTAQNIQLNIQQPNDGEEPIK